jgi:hypothetical protein
MSCKINDHVSWSRECPTFLRKVEDFNERNLDNLLPFYPTSDLWTWSNGATNINRDRNRPNAQKKAVTVSKQLNTKGKEPVRNSNTRTPNIEGWPESLDKELENLGNNGWWDNPTPGTSGTSAGRTQPSTSITFVNNAGTSAGSTTNPTTSSNVNVSTGPNLNPGTDTQCLNPRPPLQIKKLI